MVSALMCSHVVGALAACVRTSMLPRCKVKALCEYGKYRKVGCLYSFYGLYRVGCHGVWDVRA